MKNIKNHQPSPFWSRIWFSAICVSTTALQGCDGSTPSNDSNSLTPSAEALIKDWVDQDDAKTLSLGTGAKP
jgi:hypothetical protein